VRTVGVKLTADTTGYISGLARASAATKDFTGQIDKASKTGKLDRVADSALKFGVVGAAAFGYVVKSAADFDKQMSAVSAATHASSADMGRLREPPPCRPARTPSTPPPRPPTASPSCPRPVCPRRTSSAAG
jgi:hypothetical protein